MMRLLISKFLVSALLALTFLIERAFEQYKYISDFSGLFAIQIASDEQRRVDTEPSILSFKGGEYV
jgi:hypothetical protein